MGRWEPEPSKSDPGPSEALWALHVYAVRLMGGKPDHPRVKDARDAAERYPDQPGAWEVRDAFASQAWRNN